MNTLEALYGGLNDLVTVPDSELETRLESLSHPDAEWHLSDPIGLCAGNDAVAGQLLVPLRQALGHLHRRPELFISGESRVNDGGSWIAGFGHWVGNLTGPLLGLQPHDHLVFLRYGEFYRVRDGRIAEARIIIDWVDLMRQLGCLPLPGELGTEMLFPAPASHDGIRLAGSDRDESNKTVELVEAMIGDLKAFDPETFDSSGQTGKDGYWHQNMLWYGPGGIGANLSYTGFQKDHRIPFLTAFPDRVGGNHYARFGDGPYACSSGWPSIHATHKGDYLGVAATGTSITMRVMDWWRSENGQLIENWVLIDFIDLFGQMGVDLFQRARELQKSV